MHPSSSAMEPRRHPKAFQQAYAPMPPPPQYPRPPYVHGHQQPSGYYQAPYERPADPGYGGYGTPATYGGGYAGSHVSGMPESYSSPPSQHTPQYVDPSFGAPDNSSTYSMPNQHLGPRGYRPVQQNESTISHRSMRDPGMEGSTLSTANNRQHPQRQAPADAPAFAGRGGGDGMSAFSGEGASGMRGMYKEAPQQYSADIPASSGIPEPTMGIPTAVANAVHEAADYKMPKRPGGGSATTAPPPPSDSDCVTGLLSLNPEQPGPPSQPRHAMVPGSRHSGFSMMSENAPMQTYAPPPPPQGPPHAPPYGHAAPGPYPGYPQHHMPPPPHAPPPPPPGPPRGYGWNPDYYGSPPPLQPQPPQPPFYYNEGYPPSHGPAPSEYGGEYPYAPPQHRAPYPSMSRGYPQEYAPPPMHQPMAPHPHMMPSAAHARPVSGQKRPRDDGYAVSRPKKERVKRPDNVDYRKPRLNIKRRGGAESMLPSVSVVGANPESAATEEEGLFPPSPSKKSKVVKEDAMAGVKLLGLAPTSVHRVRALQEQSREVLYSSPNPSEAIRNRTNWIGVSYVPRLKKYRSFIFHPLHRKTIGCGTHSTAYEAAKARHKTIASLPAEIRAHISQDFVPDPLDPELDSLPPCVFGKVYKHSLPSVGMMEHERNGTSADAMPTN